MKALVLLLCLCLVVCTGKGEEEEDFIATDQWQDIKEGQSIPSGLHVSLDLSTGVKQAKLMSRDSPEHRVAVLDNYIDPARMEPGLKALNKQTVSGRFRSIDELKKEMPNFSFKLESEVLTKLMKDLGNTTSIPQLLIMLEQLEDLAHKYDNGQLLIKNGWLDMIFSYIIRNEHSQLYSNAARVMSAAAQSNPTVQAYCIEKGFLQMFLRKTKSLSDKQAKTSVHVIGAILRNFPPGIKAFYSFKGVRVLTDKLNSTQYSPLKRVVMALFNDLIKQEAQDIHLYPNYYSWNGTLILDSLYNVPSLCYTLAAIVADSNSELFTESVALLNYVSGSCKELRNDDKLKRVLLSWQQTEEDRQEQEEEELRINIESLIKRIS